MSEEPTGAGAGALPPSVRRDPQTVADVTAARADVLTDPGQVDPGHVDHGEVHPEAGPEEPVGGHWGSTRLPRWFAKAVWFSLLSIFAAIALWYVAAQLTDLMITVAICFFLAFAIEPTVNRLHSRRGMKRGRATMLVYLVGITVTVVFVALFGKLFFDQVVALISSLPELYERLRSSLDAQFGVTLPEGGDLIRNVVASQGTELASSVFGLLSSFLGIVFGSLTVLLVTFYLVADGPDFRRTVLSPLPARRQREVLSIWEIAIDKTSSYLVSRATLAAICATFTSVFLLIVGVPNWLALGVFTGVVAQFVPTIGTYIAGAVPVVVAFTSSGPGVGLATLVFILAYQQVENLTIEPQIGARAMELNPGVSFLSVLAGAAVLGPTGAVLALPFAATIKAFVGTYVRRHELIDSQMYAGGDEPPPEDQPSGGGRRSFLRRTVHDAR